MPELFIPELGDWLGVPDPSFYAPALLGDAGRREVAQAFGASGTPAHVALASPLRDAFAWELYQALVQATFSRHHHRAYQIDVARRMRQRASALTDFMDWLGTAESAEWHRSLVAWPPPGTRLRELQVQTARATAGDEFPPHIDADDEGLACVYAFSRQLSAVDGGVLEFFDGAGQRVIAVPPAFNRVTIFRPRGALHGVSRLADDCPLPRFTVTVFYLYDDVPAP